MFSRLISLSYLPRSLGVLPTCVKSPLARLIPCQSLSTSAALKSHEELVDHHKFPQKIYEKKNPFEGRQEMYKDVYGVTLYDLNDGQRKSLGAVVMRFKRLDWGHWIRPKAGRAKKHWKKSREQLIDNEKHVFVRPYHKKRFDRAVTSDIKEIRHIPDDPYKIYNDLSWQNYHSIKLKNMELIKKYGPKNYNFPQYMSHYHKQLIRCERHVNPFYEPPNYHNDIASGIYRPDADRPQNIMAPSYTLERRHQSKMAMVQERRYLRKLRLGSHWYGRIGPSSPLRLPMAGTKLA